METARNGHRSNANSTLMTSVVQMLVVHGYLQVAEVGNLARVSREVRLWSNNGRQCVGLLVPTSEKPPTHRLSHKLLWNPRVIVGSNGSGLLLSSGADLLPTGFLLRLVLLTRFTCL